MTKIYEYQEIMERFTNSLVEKLKPNNILRIRSRLPSKDIREIKENNTSIFPEIDQSDNIEFDSACETLDKNYELILGTIPLGLRVNLTPDEKKITSDASWYLIYKFSKFLTEKGIGFFLMTPSGFTGQRGKRFIDFMAENDVFVRGYIKLPELIFQEFSSVKPILVITTRNEQPFILGDVSNLDTIEETSNNLAAISNSQVSKEIQLNDFRGFKPIEIESKINSLKTRYKDYESIKFEDLVIQVNRGKKDVGFTELDNAIYFKILGVNKPLIIELDGITGRVDNYYQVQFNDKLSKEYLQIFFKSVIGELILDYATNSQLLSRLDYNTLASVQIPVPSISVQNQIVEVNNRITNLIKEVAFLQQQISLNPQSVDTANKIDQMLEISNSLSEGQKLKSLILNGESKKLEFKQTFQYCIKKKTREKYVEVSSIKTLVGFLNSEGGTLLIGVEDNGTILGIGEELEKFHKGSIDKYILNLKNIVKSRMGLSTLKYIDMQVVEVDEVIILHLECLPSDEEVFLDDKDFYVRTSPSTDKLEGRDLSSYVKSRFG